MASTLRQRLAVTELPKSSAASIASSDDSSTTDEIFYGEFPRTFEPPRWTMKELLDAIPKHCFERSWIRSMSYVVADFLMLGAIGYSASFIDGNFGSNGTVLNGVLGSLAKWIAWSAYWAVAGWNFTGIWICAHECGHQAFSTSKTFNNTMGLILHSFVLVPYHSWRISHAKHHAATGHMDRDEVFVPTERKDLKNRSGKKAKVDSMDLDELLEDAPAYRLFWLLVQQLFGWPAYLFNNASGQNFYPKGTNHFDPNSLIFDARHRNQILISDAALLAMGGLLTIFGHYAGGWPAVTKYYLVPYVLVNHWLVMITYLQHTDPMLPHYRAGQWNFQRGALCTIDRNMLGPVGPYLMHGITETHISHHLCSKIPHYHAWEATDALKEFLGEHYTATDENMFVSLWKNWKTCRFVDDEGDVVFYRDAYGRTSRQVATADAPSDSGVDFGDK